MLHLGDGSASSTKDGDGAKTEKSVPAVASLPALRPHIAPVVVLSRDNYPTIIVYVTLLGKKALLIDHSLEPASHLWCNSCAHSFWLHPVIPDAFTSANT